MNDARVEDGPHHEFHGESSRPAVVSSTSLKAGQLVILVCVTHELVVQFHSFGAGNGYPTMLTCVIPHHCLLWCINVC